MNLKSEGKSCIKSKVGGTESIRAVEITPIGAGRFTEEQVSMLHLDE